MAFYSYNGSAVVCKEDSSFRSKLAHEVMLIEHGV